MRGRRVRLQLDDAPEVGDGGIESQRFRVGAPERGRCLHRARVGLEDLVRRRDCLLVLARPEIEVRDGELHADRPGPGFHRFLEPADGEVVPSTRAVIGGEVDVGVDVVGLSLEHGPPLLDRRLIAAARGVDAREVHAIRNGGRERDGLLELGFCLLALLRREIGAREHIVDLGRVRVGGQERRRLADHPIRLSDAHPLRVEHRPGALVPRGDPHRVLQRAERRVAPALACVQIGDRQPRHDGAGVQLDGALERGAGVRKVPERRVGEPEHAIEARVVGCLLERGLEQPHRLVRSRRLQMRVGEAEGEVRERGRQPLHALELAQRLAAHSSPQVRLTEQVESVGLVGRVPNDLLERSGCRLGAVGGQIREREPALGLGTDRGLEVGPRLLDLPALEPQRAQPQQRVHVVGAQPARGVEDLLGLGQLAPLEIEVPQARLRVGQHRIESQGRPEGRFGRRRLALQRERAASQVVGARGARVASHGGVGQPEAVVAETEVDQEVGEVEREWLAIGTQPHRRLELETRVRDPALVPVGEAELMMRVGEAGIDLERSAKFQNGLVVLPRGEIVRPLRVVLLLLRGRAAGAGGQQQRPDDEERSPYLHACAPRAGRMGRAEQERSAVP